MLLSSLLFGLLHLSNLSYAGFKGVLVQVVSAGLMGTLFAAIYFRTGNIWLNVFLHGFWDLSVSASMVFFVTKLPDAAGFGATIDAYSFRNAISSLIYLLIAAFLLRKKKMHQVEENMSDLILHYDGV